MRTIRLANSSGGGDPRQAVPLEATTMYGPYQRRDHTPRFLFASSVAIWLGYLQGSLNLIFQLSQNFDFIVFILIEFISNVYLPL